MKLEMLDRDGVRLRTSPSDDILWLELDDAYSASFALSRAQALRLGRKLQAWGLREAK